MYYTIIPILKVVWNMSRYNDNEEKFRSTRSNTISEQLYTDMREDYGFPPAVCRSLAENFLDIMDLYYGGERDPGQVIYNAASSNVPAGRPREDVRTVPVQLTIFDPKDIDIVVEHGAEELIKHRIERLFNEAFSQGGALTQSDVAILLGISPKTVHRKMKDLQMDGTIIPSRGNLKDIGPGTSHKTRILDLYLSGDDHIEIKRKTRHSSEAIMRYIKSFARFVILYEDGFRDNQLRMLTGYSPKLLKEYEKLYHRFSKPEFEHRMEHIRQIGIKKNVQEDELELPKEGAE